MSRSVHPQQLLQQQHQQYQEQQQQQQPYTFYTTSECYNNLEQLQEGDFSTDYVSDSDGCYSDHQPRYLHQGDEYNAKQVTSGPTVMQAADSRMYGRQSEAKFPKRPHTLIAVAAENYPQYYDVAGILSSPQQYHNPSTCPVPSLSQQMSSVAQQLAFSGHQPMITISQPETTYRDYGAMPAVQQQYQTMRQHPKNQNGIVKHTTGTSKKYPITVGTPKYYRKPVSNSLYRRPSALCMPIAAQPDPAIYRKAKKPSVNAEGFNPYAHQQEMHQSMEQPSTVANKQSISNIMPHKMDSEGDVNFSTANLDEMLEKIEADGFVKKSRSRGDVTKISKYLKPRVPASVKAKEKKAQKTQKQPRDDDVERQYNITKPTKPKIREVTADSLDRLLNQLKKCDFAATSSSKENIKEKTEKKMQQKEYEKLIEMSKDNEAKRHHQETNQVIPNKSFNYKDITTQMLRSQSEVRPYYRSASDFSNTTTGDVKKTQSTGSAKTSPSGPKVQPLDDVCAIELHRSKSYIVNLIDRALSKELGTVPSDRSRREVFETMSPRKAIETVNRHEACARSQKEISLEITSALTESILSNATAPDDSDSRVASSSASAKTCCCGAEEPNYIKQLKQLRWGHLKHIQREVRRLEDLERFLDSCSISTIPEL